MAYYPLTHIGWLDDMISNTIKNGKKMFFCKKMKINSLYIY
jgi:hypothetical protein